MDLYNAVLTTLTKEICSSSKKAFSQIAKILFCFHNTLSSHIIRLDLYKAVLTNLPKQFYPTFAFCCSKFENIYNVFPNNCSAQIEPMFGGISFDNTTGMFLLKVRNNFGEDRKKLWNLLFRKLLAIFFLLDRYNADLATLLNFFYCNAGNPVKNSNRIFSLLIK